MKRSIVLLTTVFALALAPPALAHAPRPFLGTAVDMQALADEPDYRYVLGREFDSVTAENVMKWDAVEPEPGVTDYTQADRLVRFARRHHQVVRGHTLLWHNQLPAWLTEGDYSAAQLEAILRRHVIEVARHFRGRISAWDVVNEPFNEDGSWRDTIWYRAMGPDYVAKAFRWAHQADPKAKLYLNDYNLESIGPKSDAALALAKQLRAARVPINGVGFQGHLDIQYDFPVTLTQNLRRFAALGLDVAITEADVRMFVPPTEASLARQAEDFGRMAQSCRAVRRCVSFTVWGFTDRHSWVPGVFAGEGAATPFDEQLRPKPAWFAIRHNLRGW
jgi:endo-1,4-beta-xylanase